MMKYLLIIFTFLACNPKKWNPSPSNIPTEALDTIRTRPAKLDAKPILFEAAFIKGTTHKVRKTTLNFFGITIGKLKIVSGRIIACDPLHIDEYGIPFTQLFPTGEFPVQVAIATMDDAEVIAFARISFSDEPVERWEFALKEGETQIPVGEKKMRGYSTDSGTGVFLDEEAKEPLERDPVANKGGIFQGTDTHSNNGWRYSMYNFGTHNLAAFSTAFGDGFFGTYIGFDAKGKPCRLITDFGLADWKKK